MNEYVASGVMNDRERPRILLWARSVAAAKKFDWLEAKAGSFRRVANLNEVDLDEWDVLVTEEPFATMRVAQYGYLLTSTWSRVPEHLNIFRVFSSTATNVGRAYFEFNTTEDLAANIDRALRLRNGVPGHKMSRVAGLPDSLQDLVKGSLLSAAEARSLQFGFSPTGEPLEPAVLGLRPFLFGPDGLMLAGSYRRASGASVWLIPDDAIDHAAWFDQAMLEWHISDPRTYPNVGTWQTDKKWDTASESDIRRTLLNLDLEHQATVAAYEAARDALTNAFDEAQEIAKTGPKLLLTAQDDSLQGAVLEALVRLGFEVEDMDEIWDERERREDFRIRDSSATSWLVLADATGVVKGAPGSKIATVMGYVTKYVIEEKTEIPPGIWIIVNRLIQRDPLTRGDIYRRDELRVMEAQGGLAFDTAALFVLDRGIVPGSSRAEACRAWLRNSTGQVTVQDASSWLDNNP